MFFFSDPLFIAIIVFTFVVRLLIAKFCMEKAQDQGRDSATFAILGFALPTITLIVLLLFPRVSNRVA